MAWTVSDVMTREVVSVGPDTPFKVCADLLRIHHISGLPVLSQNRLTGIVTEADLMRTLAEGAATTPLTAADVMTHDVVCTAPGATIAGAARLMSDRNVKRLPVVDSARRLVGIVSRADVLRVFLRSDESIRKEIAHGLLDEMPLLGRGHVNVEVKEGVVRLTGEVDNGHLTSLLMRLISGIPGVVGVENRLTPRSAEVSEPRVASGGRRAPV